MRIVVLGGTGCFGRRVLQGLAQDAQHELIAVGRRRAGDLPWAFERLDLNAGDVSGRLAKLAPELVVDCAGPYRPDCYQVVEAALACGSHYLDLADTRDFVLGISRFDPAARQAGRVLRSGVSSVPGLSSAVVVAHLHEFSRVDAVDLGISAPEHLPGEAAVRSVLEQSGRPIGGAGGPRAQAFDRQAPPAWSDAFPVHLPAPVGRRVVSRCNVPDLALLPECLPHLRRITFRGGVASPWLMAGLRMFARLRRWGWIRNPGDWSGSLVRAARWLQPFPRGASGMFVRLYGVGVDGDPLAVCWQLVADRHQGFEVPARGAVAMAARLARGEVEPGARPCVMELTVSEYLGPAPVRTEVTRRSGAAARADEVRWRVGCLAEN